MPKIAEQLRLCQCQERGRRVGFTVTGVPGIVARSRPLDKKPRRRSGYMRAPLENCSGNLRYGIIIMSRSTFVAFIQQLPVSVERADERPLGP